MSPRTVIGILARTAESVCAMLAVPAEQKRTQAALRLLAEASAQLVSSLDYETTLQTLARVVVPGIADSCIIDLVEGDGEVRRLALASADPANEELFREAERYPACLESAQNPVAEVLRTGKSVCFPDLSNASSEAGAQDHEHLKLIRTFRRRLGLESGVIVPLLARGRTLGAITFLWASPVRRYSPADLPLLDDLACRAALAVDNARLYREAQEAIRVKNEFLTSVTHDLKNPVAAIIGNVQLLKRQVAQVAAPEAGRMARQMASVEAAALKINTLLGELLDLARLHTGQLLELDCHPCDLVALVHRVAVEQQQTTDQHAIQVACTLPKLVGTWDPIRIERIVANLLSNAVKYSPAGGEIVVDLTRAVDGDYGWAVLGVRDQGMGIPASDLPHVFEWFHRAGNVGSIRGTGIGLAGVRNIVEQHGGAISVASAEGAGAAFTVRLPLAASKHCAAA